MERGVRGKGGGRERGKVMGCWLFWGQKHPIFTCLSVFLQKLFFHLRVQHGSSDFKMCAIQPLQCNLFMSYLQKHLLICVMQKVSKGIGLRFGPSMAGEAGPHWIQLPPEEPVSPFILVGGQKRDASSR